MNRSWTIRRFAIAMISVAILVMPLNAGADVTGGLGSGFSEDFNHYQDQGASLTTNVPIDEAQWQTYPVASNGQSIPNIWVAGGVQTASLALQPNSTRIALKQSSTGAGASEPIAYVRNGNWQNLVAQVTAAYVGNSVNSGVGLAFRAPVDPITGNADPNNYYLFTSANPVSGGKYCPTNRCFWLFKRLGGAFFTAAIKPTYLNFIPANNQPGESHVYKVIMTDDPLKGGHIMCFVDGQLVFNVYDTPGDDINGDFRMPGPMFANGTVGLRTSSTRAWFDDFTVLGDGPRAYETRAAAMNTFGQVGNGTNGTVIQQTAADSGYQYNDHDFLNNASGTTQINPANGIAGGALVATTGENGASSASSQVLGFSGTLTQPMPDGSTVQVTLTSDTLSASASATCDTATASVTIVNFSYLIVVRDANGQPVVNKGDVTQFTPSPNTVIADPATNGGYVRIVANSQMVTDTPKRADVSAIRIDFLATPARVDSGDQNVANSGLTTASIQLANAVAGRLCTPVL